MSQARRDPPPKAALSSGPHASDRVRRLLITLAGCGAFVAARRWPLPVNLGLPELAVAPGPDHTGVMAIGLVPFVASAVCVEIAALVIPRWRRLRDASPEGRRKLWRAAVVLGVLFALVQSFFLARWMGSQARFVARYGFPSVPPDALGTALITMTLAAGASLALGVAAAVSRFGLGSGFSVLLATVAVEEAVLAVRAAENLVIDGPAIGRIVAPGAAVLLVLIWSLRRRSTGLPGIGIPAPASGLMPATWATAVPASIGPLAVFGALSEATAARFAEGTFEHRATLVLLALPLAWLLTFAFNRPRRVAAVAQRMLDDGGGGWDTSDCRRIVRRAAVTSSLFVLGALALQEIMHAAALPFDAAAVIVVVAVAMDLVAEWTARRETPLVPVCSLHRPYQVGAVVAALRRAGIQAHARSLHHRALLQLFGPYVPIAVLVPPSQAAEAAHVASRVHPPGEGGTQSFGSGETVHTPPGSS